MKVSKLNSTQEFLNKLDNITINKVDGKKLIGQAYGKEFTISYTINVMTNLRDGYPIQVIIDVKSNDIHVQSWGCMSNEDNEITLRWFNAKEREFEDMEYEREKITRNEARWILDSL